MKSDQSPDQVDPQERTLPPAAKRIDGAKHTDLKDIRARRAEAKANRPNAPVEDARVSDAWRRQDRRDIAAAKNGTERDAIRREAARPRQTVQVQKVDNPYFAPEHAISSGNPKKTVAAKNIRESAVETLYGRGFIDEAQKRAADKFRALWESMGGKVNGLDYTSDRVDGGKGDPITARLTAAQELERCRSLLGRRAYDLVCCICGEGHALGDLFTSNREKTTAADTLRAALDDLGELWGMVRKKTERSSHIRSQRL